MHHTQLATIVLSYRSSSLDLLQSMYIWVSSDAPPQLLSKIFGVNNFEAIPEDMVVITLPLSITPSPHLLILLSPSSLLSSLSFLPFFPFTLIFLIHILPIFITSHFHLRKCTCMCRRIHFSYMHVLNISTPFSAVFPTCAR